MAWYGFIGRKLYIRIWLVIAGSVVVLGLVTGMTWHLGEQERLRHPSVCQVIVHDASGAVIASETESVQHTPGGGLDFKVNLGKNSRQSAVEVEVTPNCPNGDGTTAWWNWLRPPYGFWWVLTLTGILIMACVLPLARRLTRRLEALQYSAERWEQGDLSIRCPESGNDEVADLTRHFNAAADRIAARIESQKSLLAYASHELRTPLARIRMAAELGPQSDPASQRMRAEIQQNIHDLDQIIGKMLTVSRLEIRHNLFDAEQVDLIGLLAEECARMDVPFSVAASAAADPARCVVTGSLLLLRQAVRNLLENAARHGLRADGRCEATVQIEYDGTDEPAALIHVDDRGPGVPADQCQQIFEPFYVLAGASQRGFGLGLALVRMIAQRHGGSITYSDREGGGARFTLRLPRQAAPDGA